MKLKGSSKDAGSRMNTRGIRGVGRAVRYMPLSAGEIAPNFISKASDNKYFKLSDFRIKFRVILFFFESFKEQGAFNTMLAFRDNKELFKQYMTFTAGISADSADAQFSMVKSNTLPYPLISDAANRIARLYGVVRTNSRGKRLIAPSVFLIDEKGVIRRRWDTINEGGWLHDVYDYVKDLYMGYDDILKRIALITEDDF